MYDWAKKWNRLVCRMSKKINRDKRKNVKLC